MFYSMAKRSAWRSHGFLWGLSWLCIAAVAASEAEPAAEIKLIAEAHSAGDPAQSLRPLPTVRVQQGQEIFYTVRIRNPRQHPVTTLSVVQPLPANTRYVAGSATGAGADITFSADGGRSFARPMDLKMPDDTQPVPTQRYTHIRWQLRYPLAPGAVVLARFRGIFQ